MTVHHGRAAPVSNALVSFSAIIQRIPNAFVRMGALSRKHSPNLIVRP